MESPKGNFDADLKETCMDTIFGYHAQIVQQDWSDFVVKQNLWFKALNFLFRIVLVILKKEKNPTNLLITELFEFLDMRCFP